MEGCTFKSLRPLISYFEEEKCAGNSGWGAINPSEAKKSLEQN